MTFKCPHCGWEYDPQAKKWSAQQRASELVPTHDYPPPCRAVCPGSGQARRDLTDDSPLWKDLPV